MYNYLVNALPLYNNPSIMQTTLSDRVENSNTVERFNGNSSTVDFVLSSIPSSSAYFSYKIDNSNLDGEFNYNDNTATLSSTPAVGVNNVEIEWYSVGYFNQVLTNSQQVILSKFLVGCWAEKEKNFLLDIRRLLNDTDFKLSSEAPNINAKGNWFYNMREQAEKQMMQDSWVGFYNTMKSRISSS
jgi:hypothetical protein